MEKFLTLVIIFALMIGLSFFGLAIKVIFKKNGKFSGTCASNSPYLNKKGESCSYCGAKPEEICKK